MQPARLPSERLALATEHEQCHVVDGRLPPGVVAAHELLLPVDQIRFNQELLVEELRLARMTAALPHQFCWWTGFTQPPDAARYAPFHEPAAHRGDHLRAPDAAVAPIGVPIGPAVLAGLVPVGTAVPGLSSGIPPASERTPVA